MEFPQIDPVAIAFGPIAIRWYSLGFIFGISLAWAYGRMLLARPDLWPGSKPPFDRTQWLDFLFTAIVGIIVGGRLGYVAFYNAPYFMANPLDIFKLWQGGMSFHGGLIGLSLAIWLFCRKHKVSILTALDLLAAISAIGLLFGRIANFVNGELFGRITDVPWGIIFPGGGPLPRHPSQLYEAALEGVVLFFAIRVATHMFASLRRPGLTAGLFGVGYATARILVETVREPDIQIGLLPGGLTMGMVLSIPVALAGVWLIVAARRQPARE
ncbi:MAG: prolipoprotein diacylglyceryl transferase [Alphaproteobacteria bacterium]|nr:prolipoprotein diacylglyceryl transferase [Alphaproteobacteria bacterium]